MDGPGSYTHLDVYKRQAQGKLPVFSIDLHELQLIYGLYQTVGAVSYTHLKGAMIGMATTVWPEPEPMNTLMNAFAMNIPTAAIALLKWLKGMEM